MGQDNRQGPSWQVGGWLAAAIALLSSSGAAIAQTEGYCFVTDDIGDVYDLGPLCRPDSPVTSDANRDRNEPELQTGDVQVTLRWDTIDDLDLYVTDPAGDTVAYFNPAIPSGGALDVDANAACSGNLTPTPVENIFWPSGQSPSGTFDVTVTLYTYCRQSPATIPFELTVLVQGETTTFTGAITPENPTVEFTFQSP